LQRVSLRVVPVNNTRSGIDVRPIRHAKLVSMSSAKQDKDRLSDSRSQHQDSENQD
jgi:hypothetical protein